MIDVRHDDDGTASVIELGPRGGVKRVVSRGHSDTLAALHTVRDHADLHPKLHGLVGRGASHAIDLPDHIPLPPPEERETALRPATKKRASHR